MPEENAVEGEVPPVESVEETVPNETTLESDGNPTSEVTEPSQGTESPSEPVEGNESGESSPGPETSEDLSVGSGEGNDTEPVGTQASETGTEEPTSGESQLDETPVESPEDHINALACSSYEACYEKNWADASLVDREAHTALVKAIVDNPSKTAEQHHDELVKVKVESGWTYGPVESERDKTSPLVIPFNALTDELKAGWEELVSYVKAHN